MSNHGDIKRMGERAGAGAFKKGPDPRRNPGGRPALAKAWQAAIGMSTAQVSAEALKLVWEVFVQGPGTSGKTNDPNDPNWRFAAQKVLEYSLGKPRETLEVIEPEARSKRVDWSAVPLERRRELLGAIRELRELTAEEPSDGDAGPTEH